VSPTSIGSKAGKGGDAGHGRATSDSESIDADDDYGRLAAIISLDLLDFT